jgi:hypothetical protein
LKLTLRQLEGRESYVVAYFVLQKPCTSAGWNPKSFQTFILSDFST